MTRTRKHQRHAGDTSEQRPSDAVWIVPFFAIVTSSLVFFFSEMAQYGLFPH